MIREAIEFFLSEVDYPALKLPILDKEIKNKLINTKARIRSFKKVGDLNIYMSRFARKPEPSKAITYNALKELNLSTYEDAYPLFLEKFQRETEDVTVLSDFIIGKVYTSWDISNFSRAYDNRMGIYLVGEKRDLKAVFIKVTLENGRYPNEWIEKDHILKYYLKNRGQRFSLEYEDNQAIYNTRKTNIPIYVFIKEDTQCYLTGIFKYISHHTGSDNSMWFTLGKLDNYKITNPVTAEEYQKELENKIKQSKVDDENNRLQRLATAPTKPETVVVITTQYKRNADVIAEVLLRAKGYCEYCKNEAPFKRLKDGTPFLEVHHIIPLSQDGEDTVENAVALCPNCHRKTHYG